MAMASNSPFHHDCGGIVVVDDVVTDDVVVDVVVVMLVVVIVVVVFAHAEGNGLHCTVPLASCNIGIENIALGYALATVSLMSYCVEV